MDRGELWHGRVPVACVRDVFVSDGTWYATVEGLLAGGRLAEFVAFCVDWNERLQRADPPDATEFDRYPDLIAGGWTFRPSDGSTRTVDQAPVFFPGAEVSWREPG